MASLEKRVDSKGNVTYRVQIRLKGHKEVAKNFKTEEEARSWGKKTEDAIRGKSEIPYFTLNIFFDRFESDVVPTKNQLYKDKHRPYIAFWRESLGKKIASEITPTEIEMLADSLYNKTTRLGNPYSPETRRKYLWVLGNVYNIAMKEWKWVLYNPVSSVSLHNDQIKQSQNREKEKTPFPIKEFKKKFLCVLEGQLKNAGVPNHPGIGLCGLSGISKTSLQKIYDPDCDITLKNLLKLAECTGIEFNITPTKQVT